LTPILFVISLLGLLAYGEEIPDYFKPYSPIFTDKEIYTWTDKVIITIVAPSWNAEKYGIDSIGTQEGHFIKISAGRNSLKPYQLIETGKEEKKSLHSDLVKNISYVQMRIK